MDRSTYDLFYDCVVRIDLDSKTSGTGFFVAPGYVVTCAHVVDAARESKHDVVVTWSNQRLPAQIVQYFQKPYPDLALLRVEFSDHPCVLLGDEVQLHDSLHCYGYSLEDVSSGAIVIDPDPVTIEFEGMAGARGREMLKLKGGQIRSGLSGAPLLNERTGAVCGVVKSSRNIATDLGGRAIPVAEIAKRMPDIAAAQQQFHERDSRWLSCLNGARRQAPSRLAPKEAHSLSGARDFLGRTAEIDALLAFWQDSGSGVCAIIGIGGCGKTAIVQQFLERQGWLTPQGTDDGPAAIFIWSFYLDERSKEFFTQAYDYFLQFVEDAVDRPVDHQREANAFLLAETLEQGNRRVLLVLDGLEKMQSSGEIDGSSRGELRDTSLRNLLERIADGRCGQARAIITSRLQLTDLKDTRHKHFHYIAVDQLALDTACELLRYRGVRGSLTEVQRIAQEYGLHALTIDLLGTLLHEYYEGDPTKAIDLPHLETALGHEYVEKQAGRLRRVLRAYESKLPPVMVAILERLSIFRKPVSISLLKALFLARNKASIAGPLANIRGYEFRADLHSLSSRGLVTLEEDQETREELFTSHPVIRDHFYLRLMDTANQSASPVQIHDAVRRHLATLIDAPGYIHPTNSQAINLIEELIYHAIRVGRTKEAYEVYREKLGYMHLGWGLGDHATGASVMKLFMSEENLDRGDIEQSEWERLMIDYGLYLKNLGRLDGAILFLQRTIAEEKIKQASAKNLALALQNLSAVQVLRGLLRDAELSAREAREWAGSTTDRRLFADCSVRLATSLALRGRVQEAEELFEEVLALMRAQGDKEPARDLPGIRLAWLLIRLGRLEEADTVLREARTLSEKFGFGIITARVDALMAILACSAGMQHEAQQAIDRVREWALRRFDQEMLVASHLAVSLWAVRTQDVKWAERSIRDGLIEAMAWGYGVYWIDLKVLQGQLALLADRAHDARSCADAILAGVSQPESGQPRLFGAATAESRYLWGEGDAYQLRAEAHMMLGNRESARQDLIAAERIRSGLHDPNLTKTQSLLQQFLSIEV